MKYEIKNNCISLSQTISQDDPNAKVTSYLLQNLIESEDAVLNGDSIEVPFDKIYNLDRTELDILQLPDLYPYDMFVQQKGLLIMKPEFVVTFRRFAPNGDIIIGSRKGPFLITENANYLLPKEMYKLCCAVEEFNKLSNKGRIDNFKTFSKIKSLSSQSAICLDKAVQDKEVLEAKHIKIDFSLTENGLEIVPRIKDNNGQFEESFAEAFDNNDIVNDIVNVRSNGKSVSIIVDKDQQEQLKIAKNNRVIKDPKKIKDIIEGKTKLFDGEKVDIKDFDFYGPRVLSVDYFEPKVSPFADDRFSSNWIPQYRIEDNINGETTIEVANKESFNELSKAIEDAERQGKNFVEYQNSVLTLDQAKEIQKDSSRVYGETGGEDLDLEEKETEDQDTTAGRKPGKVLIVEENTDNLDYSEDAEGIFEGRYVFHPNNNLKEEFKIKEHQKEGIAWLQTLIVGSFQKKLSHGCLLADDMGLGKTLQVLYTIDWHAQYLNKEDKPYLLVAPVSLLENWKQEYSKFFKKPIPVQILSNVPNEIDKRFIDSIQGNKKLYLIGYEAMRNAQQNIGAISFALAILDEAQKIKTPSTMVTNAAKALHADFKIAMTGTPVENTFGDLWCISDFAVPGLLGNARQFSSEFNFRDPNADIEGMGRRIREKIEPYFIRRLKEAIAKELPSKNDVVLQKEMPLKQKKYYNAVLASAQEAYGQSILETIQHLRAISDHPYMQRTNIWSIDPEELISSSAKMISTFEILDKIKQQKEKVIIFIERRNMQVIMQIALNYRYQIKVHVINGDTESVAKEGCNVMSRQQLINDFEKKEGFNVIVMSPIAAGVGLNVVGANHVIHYSRHWNPAKEMQATDRAYRIGQKKDVFVYYPMAIAKEYETFDLVLDNLLKRKKKLASATLYPTKSMEVSAEEISSALLNSGCTDEQRLHFEDIEDLSDSDFEAFVSLYFKKKGNTVKLTNKVGNKGVDVLVNGPKSYFAVCALKSGNIEVERCIEQIILGAKIAATKSGSDYKPMIFSKVPINCSSNGVEIISKKEISDFLNKEHVTLSEINKENKLREDF